jgi:hypothetical protein
MTHTPHWHLHGLSVTGHRHLVDDIPCQDDWGIAADGRDDSFVLVVADGAGSRQYAKEGAGLAVKLAERAFAPDTAPRDPGSATGWLRQCFAALRADFLRGTGSRADDHATTLTVVVHTPDWLGHFSVGDGFAVLRSGVEQGEPRLHLLPQPAAVSEYSNEAFFVTSDDAAERAVAHCVVDPAVDGILLSTDGLAQAALVSPGNDRRRINYGFVPKVLASLERTGLGEDEEERETAALLSSRALARANADDKTLVRAVRW